MLGSRTTSTPWPSFLPGPFRAPQDYSTAPAHPPHKHTAPASHSRLAPNHLRGQDHSYRRRSLQERRTVLLSPPRVRSSLRSTAELLGEKKVVLPFSSLALAAAGWELSPRGWLEQECGVTGESVRYAPALSHPPQKPRVTGAVAVCV